jgi:hypothetical protein
MGGVHGARAADQRPFFEKLEASNVTSNILNEAFHDHLELQLIGIIAKGQSMS